MVLEADQHPKVLCVFIWKRSIRNKSIMRSFLLSFCSPCIREATRNSFAAILTSLLLHPKMAEFQTFNKVVTKGPVLNQSASELVLKKAVGKGEPLMTFTPKAREYHPTISGMKRCQNCGTVIPKFVIINCRKCLAISYCSTMCLVKHRNEIHQYECDVLRQLVDLEDLECTPRAIIITRLLIVSQSSKDFRGFMKNLKVNGHNSLLSYRELQFLGLLYDPQDVKNAQTMYNCHSRPLLNSNFETVGSYFEPSFATIPHSCDPSTVVMPLSPQKFEVVSARKLLDGETLSVSYIAVDQPKAIRQCQLLLLYNIRCVCSLCESNTLDPFVSFSCPSCQTSIYEIDIDNILSSFKSNTAIEDSKRTICRSCGREQTRNQIMEAKGIYKEVLFELLRHHRISPKRGHQNLSISKIVKELIDGPAKKPLSDKRQACFLKLIQKSSKTKMMSPYCFPINLLYKSVAERFLLNISDCNGVKEGNQMVRHCLFTLFHVELAAQLTAYKPTLVHLLEKAERLMWSFTQLSKNRCEATRIKASKARTFFKAQALAFKIRTKRMDAEALGLARKYLESPELLDDDIRRCAERMLLASQVALKVLDEGYYLRFADGKEDVVLFPLTKCLQLMQSVRLS